MKDIKEKGYDPLVYRILCYTCSYRNKLNFTWEGIEAASKTLERLRNGYKSNINGTDILNNEDLQELERLEEEFHKAINDDMNMPLAMSFVWEVIKFNKKSPEVAKILLKFDSVLGIEIDKEDTVINIPVEVLNLAKDRQQARKQKDWTESDRLRDEIKKLGFEIKDSKEGFELTKI